MRKYKKQILVDLDTRPYRIPIKVIFDDDMVRVKNSVEKILNVEYDNFESGYNGRTCWNKDDMWKGIVMLFKNRIGGYTIAHECFHATRLILGGAGITLCDESEEAYAYFIGELVYQIESIKR